MMEGASRWGFDPIWIPEKDTQNLHNQRKKESHRYLSSSNLRRENYQAI